jgi:hypothetical protein
MAGLLIEPRLFAASGLSPMGSEHHALKILRDLNILK